MREKPFPTKRVEELLIEGGHTPHPIWLDFHDTYAGYIQPVGGGDAAIWGLVRDHEPKYWFEPGAIPYVSKTPRKPGETVPCADVHPVHDYLLDSDGRFHWLGGACRTFEIMLERQGLVHGLYQQGRVERTVLKYWKKPASEDLEAVAESMKDAQVDEASDEGSRYYAKDSRILVHSVRLDTWQLFTAHD